MGRRPMDVTLRRAVIADLPSVWRVLHAIEYGRSEQPPSLADVPSYLEHELATGTMWVADRGGQVVGYAAAVRRGDVRIIAELFVSAAERSRGFGRALLDRLLTGDAGPVWTMSSSDPRALSLYVRAGLQPAWPQFHLIGDPANVTSPEPPVELEVAHPGDEEMIAWDAAVSGRARPEDHAYWQTAGQGIAVWCRRHGTVVGYGYAQPQAASGRRPECVIVGPVGAKSSSNAVACVLAVVRSAAVRNGLVHLAVPGMHPSLPSLLRADFRVRWVETFCSTGGAAGFDPRAYVPSTTMEGTALL